MKTERALELLKHFKNNGVSQEPGDGLNIVLEYQDIIGHSNAAEIRDFETELDQNSRKNFVWVNFLTLSQATALDIFKSTVADRWLNKQADILEDDYNNKLTDVYARERTLEEGKRTIYKRIRKLTQTKFFRLSWSRSASKSWISAAFEWPIMSWYSRTSSKPLPGSWLTPWFLKRFSSSTARSVFMISPPIVRGARLRCAVNYS